MWNDEKRRKDIFIKMAIHLTPAIAIIAYHNLHHIAVAQAFGNKSTFKLSILFSWYKRRFDREV